MVPPPPKGVGGGCAGVRRPKVRRGLRSLKGRAPRARRPPPRCKGKLDAGGETPGRPGRGAGAFLATLTPVCEALRHNHALPERPVGIIRWGFIPGCSVLRCTRVGAWGEGRGVFSVLVVEHGGGPPPCKLADACGTRPTLRHCFLPPRCTLLRRGLLGGTWRSGEWGLCHLTPHPENAPALSPCARWAMDALYICLGLVWQRGLRPGHADSVGGGRHPQTTFPGPLRMGAALHCMGPNSSPTHAHTPS
jgi:hypothetical protein